MHLISFILGKIDDNKTKKTISTTRIYRVMVSYLFAELAKNVRSFVHERNAVFHAHFSFKIDDINFL